MTSTTAQPASQAENQAARAGLAALFAPRRIALVGDAVIVTSEDTDAKPDQ